jgi:hypothetical protein
VAAAKDFIQRQAKGGRPFFCRWNGAPMHFRIHVKAKHRSLCGQYEYRDGRVEHGLHVAVCYRDWQGVFMEDCGEAFGVWRAPSTVPRVPLLFNLRRDPFEKTRHNSSIYNGWFLDRPFVIVPIRGLAAKFLHDDDGISAGPDVGILQAQQDR